MVQNMTTFGRAPRFFAIDKTGRHLIVCNKRSGSIRTFILGEDGKLILSTLPAVWTPWPLALEFVARQE